MLLWSALVVRERSWWLETVGTAYLFLILCISLVDDYVAGNTSVNCIQWNNPSLLYFFMSYWLRFCTVMSTAWGLSIICLHYVRWLTFFFRGNNSQPIGCELFPLKKIALANTAKHIQVSPHKGQVIRSILTKPFWEWTASRNCAHLWIVWMTPISTTMRYMPVYFCVYGRVYLVSYLT